jgi:hypothetical protein
MDNVSQLLKTPTDRTLDLLESEVWQQVGERQQARVVGRRRVSAQAMILLMALIGSVGFGINATHDLRDLKGREVFSLALNLAPSSLLLSQSR